MKRLILVCLAAVPLVLSACGESSQDKAQKQVCNAAADIRKQVNELSSLTPTTATANGVKNNVNAIKDDLKQIKDAESKLNDQRKKEVQAASDEFVAQFKSIASEVGTSLSISSAQAKLKTATQQLAASYKSTFAKVDCSS